MGIIKKHLSNTLDSTTQPIQEILNNTQDYINIVQDIKKSAILPPEDQKALEQLIPILSSVSLALSLASLPLDLRDAWNAKNKNILLAAQLSLTSVSLILALTAAPIPILTTVFFSFCILNHFTVLGLHWKDKEWLKKRNLMYPSFTEEYSKTMTKRTLMLFTTFTVIAAILITIYSPILLPTTIAWLTVIALIFIRIFNTKTGLLEKISPYKINNQEEQKANARSTALLKTWVKHAIKLNKEIQTNPHGFESKKREEKFKLSLGNIIFLLLLTETTKKDDKLLSISEFVNQHPILKEILKKIPKSKSQELKHAIAEKIKEMESAGFINLESPVMHSEDFNAFIKSFEKSHLRSIAQSFLKPVSKTEQLTLATEAFILDLEKGQLNTNRINHTQDRGIPAYVIPPIPEHHHDASPSCS